MEEPEKIPEILEPIVVEPTEKPIEEIPDEEKEKEKQPSGRTMSKGTDCIWTKSSSYDLIISLKWYGNVYLSSKRKEIQET